MLSWATLRRALRRLGCSFRRARRVPLKTPSPAQRARVARALSRLHLLEQAGKCHVWFADESGFCLQPVVPYLWQKKGQTLGVPTNAHSKRFNVLGFLRRDGHLESVTRTETVTAAHFIAAVETLLPKLMRPSVLVLDNARIHRNAAVKDKRREWKDKGLRLLFLPPYCPHLNPIERLWRQMKYHWLCPTAYTTFPTLCQKVRELLEQVGDKYHVSFG